MNDDFPRDVLNVILSHEPPLAIERMMVWWKGHVAPDSILLVYGGRDEHFEAISHTSKIFIDDSRLRTRDHQREMQSYTAIFQAAGDFLKTQAARFNFIHFAEYDHVPVARGLNKRQVERLREEDADVLAYHLHRIDQTSSPHFLYHAADERFANFWSKITTRSNSGTILSMFGSGSFWTRGAFCSVAAVAEPFPIYMEIYLPTLAHHLGFRLRHLADQDRFVRALPNEITSLEQAGKEGAWTLHPIKDQWSK